MARIAKGYNQTGLGKLVGLSQSTIHELERKDLDPGIMLTWRLCKILDLDMIALLSGRSSLMLVPHPKAARAPRKRKNG